MVDGLLRFLVSGGMIGGSLLLPGATIGLAKPFNKLMDKLDERGQQRQAVKLLAYMKNKQLVSYDNTYSHGITITEKGRQRLAKANFNKISIKRLARWDGVWRVVVFDIPEKLKPARNALRLKLRALGFQPLQRSVWIHPFPCHAEIEAVTLYYSLTDFVTYIETSYIDKPHLLKRRFIKLLS